MCEAVLNLITREAVELHFQGATYGPVAHTEQLAVLLFLLAPSNVRCIANGEAFEHAMRRLLTAAQDTRTRLEKVADGADTHDLMALPPAAAVDCWVEAAWLTVPSERIDEFRQRCVQRMERAGRGSTIH